MNRKYKYYLSTSVYVGGLINISFLWRREIDTKIWELSANKPDNWSLHNDAPEPETMFPDKADWVTKREAKRFFPLASIV